MSYWGPASAAEARGSRSSCMAEKSSQQIPGNKYNDVTEKAVTNKANIGLDGKSLLSVLSYGQNYNLYGIEL